MFFFLFFFTKICSEYVYIAVYLDYVGTVWGWALGISINRCISIHLFLIAEKAGISINMKWGKVQSKYYFFSFNLSPRFIRLGWAASKQPTDEAQEGPLCVCSILDELWEPKAVQRRDEAVGRLADGKWVDCVKLSSILQDWIMSENCAVLKVQHLRSVYLLNSFIKHIEGRISPEELLIVALISMLAQLAVQLIVLNWRPVHRGGVYSRKHRSFEPWLNGASWLAH